MVLSKFDIYYNIPDPGPVVPLGTLDYPSDTETTGRPVAMTLNGDEDRLYVLVDDPTEIDNGVVEADSVQGKLWIVDLSDPTAPDTLYFGGLTGVDATFPASLQEDLGNPADVQVAGDQLFIASQVHGLLAVDVSDPEVPLLFDMASTTGQVSGVALLPSVALLAGGDTPLAVVNLSNTCEEDAP